MWRWYWCTEQKWLWLEMEAGCISFRESVDVEKDTHFRSSWSLTQTAVFDIFADHALVPSCLRFPRHWTLDPSGIASSFLNRQGWRSCLIMLGLGILRRPASRFKHTLTALASLHILRRSLSPLPHSQLQLQFLPRHPQHPLPKPSHRAWTTATVASIEHDTFLYREATSQWSIL